MDFTLFFRVMFLAILCAGLSSCYNAFCNTCTSCTDHDITEAVQIRFLGNRCLSYQYLKTSTYQRVVSIRGRVENPEQRAIAICLVKTVPCVRGVIADIKIKRPDFT